MVYVKCNEDGTYKSSVDKFYDQDDLVLGRRLEQSRRYDFCSIWSLPIKQEHVKRIAYGISYTFGIKKPTEFAPLWVVDFHY
jgi:aspartyl-tRNA synthetase